MPSYSRSFIFIVQCSCNTDAKVT